ncbi:unnamed protein product [Ectocarpus sp. 8 AP-2014]
MGEKRWSFRGPSAAIQFFKRRGIPCVIFVPNWRMSTLTPNDECYPEFEEALRGGEICRVPAKKKDDLFILRYAIGKKAYVVSNDQFRDHARSSQTLAALGLNAAELQAFLAQHQVCYTFARAEFIPDPEANLIRMITQQEAEKRREMEAMSLGTAGPHGGPAQGGGPVLPQQG